MITFKDFKQISPYLWEVPKSFRHDMRVPARVYATRQMLLDILGEKSIEQLVNATTLPGIDKYAIAMPDIHQGYGFPIGGVAAVRVHDGIISPGAIGYDINCGIRLLLSPYAAREVHAKIPDLADQIYRNVPSGVGRGGKMKLHETELNEVLDTGVKWAVRKGFAFETDPEVLEENGSFTQAKSEFVSHEAKKRGCDQLGTLGAGNHFLEIQEVVQVFDEEVARVYGLSLGQLTVMIHTGSRGLGHQNCTDYVRVMNRIMEKYKIRLPDRELACTPFTSAEGNKYFHAMAACANFAWTNRQLITHGIRKSFDEILGQGSGAKLTILYDVAHNIAKLEIHNGVKYLVHRKGATRAFGPGHKDVTPKYRGTGQPVLIPGSMGTFSYVLAGTKESMDETFGSSCHGAGRRLSRTRAKRTIDYSKVASQLEKYGVTVRAGSKAGLLEEAPEAYKDIDQVIDVVHNAKIAKKVVKLKPVAIIKG